MSLAGTPWLNGYINGINHVLCERFVHMQEENLPLNMKSIFYECVIYVYINYITEIVGHNC